jgi:hypothetical protein
VGRWLSATPPPMLLLHADKLLMLTRCHQYLNRNRQRERALSAPPDPSVDREDSDDSALAGFADESDADWGSDDSLGELGK